MKFDAVIIGGGNSGCAAARACLDKGLKTCVIADGLRLGADPTHPYGDLSSLAQAGATVLRGDRAVSGIWQDGRIGGRLLAVRTANLEDDPVAAGVFVLASGKFFSRGLLAGGDRVYEPVFGADVDYIPDRTKWYSADFFASQPFLDFGVKTAQDGRVLFAGEPAENLYAVGKVLAKDSAAADVAGVVSKAEDLDAVFCAGPRVAVANVQPTITSDIASPDVTSPNGTLEQCLKCNLCTLVCPMLAVNDHYPGPKKAGPDGERYRLKDPEYYDYALKYCLNCKRCEVSCPSGVKIGDIIQGARLKYAGHNLRDWVLASTDLVGSLASPFAGIVNPVLKAKPVKALMHGVMGVDKHRTFPSYSSQTFERWFKKNSSAEAGSSRPAAATSEPAQSAGFDRYVSFYHGCYANYNYPQLGKDFVKVVNSAGYGVHLLDKERCCGVALISNSFGKQAEKQARTNLESMRKAIAAGEEILTVSSTCTFTMRDEYHHVLGLDNADVRPHLMLLSKWLCEKISSGEVAVEDAPASENASRLHFRKDFKMRVAYHTACHMQKLGWRNYTLELLKMIPGVELVELEPNCCGIAGTFGFKKENYAWSQAIGGKLFDDIRSSGADCVITECETCKWQIEMSTGVPVLNPVSLLAQALC